MTIEQVFPFDEVDDETQRQCGMQPNPLAISTNCH